jgi:phospholipid N-methyltransferase
VQEIRQSAFRVIGAWGPSSNSLASAMTRFVSSDKKQNILEVGAGAGAITKHILNNPGLSHHLDVVEIYPFLAKVLRRRFAKKPGVHVHALDILDFRTPYKYDLIVCSLPFNSMYPEIVEPIIIRLLELAHSNAIMSFFEFKILQSLGRPFLTKKQRESYMRTRHLIDQLLERYKFDDRVVNFNIPPALVHYLQLS